MHKSVAIALAAVVGAGGIGLAHAQPWGDGYGPGGMGPGMMWGGGGGYGPGWRMGRSGGGGYYCPGWAGPGGGPAGYTQQGDLNLTVDQVKAELGHRLNVMDNPHLKVGTVTATSTNSITATVVTADNGGMVQRFDVNRHTGVWQPEQ